MLSVMKVKISVVTDDAVSAWSAGQSTRARAHAAACADSLLIVFSHGQVDQWVEAVAPNWDTCRVSSANLDFVRSIYAAWELGDFSRAPQWADPAIEWVNFGGPAAGGRTGVEAVAEFWRELLSSWEDLRADPQEYLELDDDRVLVLSRLNGRNKDGGYIDHLRASLFCIDRGKVRRLIFYWDPERAFADLGLPPHTGAAGA
jgi:ketosteroid isomerase-like protein